MTTAPQIHWAIVGCGRVAQRRVAPVFARLNQARLHAFCSRDLSRAREYVRLFNAPAAYDSLDAMLGDKHIDAVYIALPNCFHASTTIACLRAGKHVLCDKPLATSLADAIAMADVAKRSSRTLSVLHQQRFHPGNQKLIQQIRSGELGRLLSIRAHIGFFYPPGDLWRLDPARSGGGAWIDLAPHALDMMLQCAGPIRTISGMTRNLCFNYPVEDYAAAQIEFISGAVGHLETSYCAHAYGGRLEVYGDAASICIDGSLQAATRYRFVLRKPNDQIMTDDQPATVDCFEHAIADFSDALIEGRQPLVTIDDAVATIGAIETLYQHTLKR